MTVQQAERRGFIFSIVIAVVLSAAALILGIATGTRVLVFDGAYGVVGIAVSWASLAASGLASRDPNRRYPFGRQALVPVIVVVQGIATLATILLGAGDAIIVILSGGKPVDAGVVVAYSAVSTVVSLVFAIWLRRQSAGSDMLAAEAVAWRAGAIRGLILTLGAGIALILAAMSFTTALNYVDPVLVLISCVLLAPMPFALLRHGMNELLEGAPSAELAGEVDAAVESVRARFELREGRARTTKVGRKLSVEVVFLAQPGTTIAQVDDVRRELLALLESPDRDVWATIEFTADEALAD